MRYVVILAVLLGAIVAVACSGGDEQAPRFDEHYAQRAAGLINRFRHATDPLGCQEDVASCDAGRWRQEMDAFRDEFSSLQPLAEVLPSHEGLVDAFGLLSPGMQVLPAEFEDRWRQWSHEVEDAYDVEFFTVEGYAMAPTLTDQEMVALDLVQGRPLVRHEVVMFNFHLDPSRDFIKRIVGLPGETIEVRDGTVYVDGVALVEDYLLNQPNYSYGPKTVPEGRYFVLGDNRRNSFDSHAWDLACPPEQPLCGFVPEENIIGVLPADAKGQQDD